MCVYAGKAERERVRERERERERDKAYRLIVVPHCVRDVAPYAVNALANKTHWLISLSDFLGFKFLLTFSLISFIFQKIHLFIYFHFSMR